MPSKTVSFSDEVYMEIVNQKPEDLGFSEWVDALADKGLENRGEIESYSDVNKAYEQSTNGDN